MTRVALSTLSTESTLGPDRFVKNKCVTRRWGPSKLFQQFDLTLTDPPPGCRRAEMALTLYFKAK